MRATPLRPGFQAILVLRYMRRLSFFAMFMAVVNYKNLGGGGGGGGGGLINIHDLDKTMHRGLIDG